MNDADLFRPYLDQTAEKLMWSASKKPFNVSGLRAALRRVLVTEGMESMRVPAALGPMITAYFDAHEAFERVSDEPTWRLRVKTSRP